MCADMCFEDDHAQFAMREMEHMYSCGVTDEATVNDEVRRRWNVMQSRTSVVTFDVKLLPEELKMNNLCFIGEENGSYMYQTRAPYYGARNAEAPNDDADKAGGSRKAVTKKTSGTAYLAPLHKETLKELCHDTMLSSSGNKGVLMQRLAESHKKPCVLFHKAKKETLKMACDDMSLCVSGNKAELVARILSM